MHPTTKAAAVTKPDPADRPSLVVWAYRCWVASGTLLVALGVLYMVIGALTSGERLLGVGVGAIVLAVGVAFILLGTKAYTGDDRWRSSLAALTLVVTIILLVLSFGVPTLAFALVAAIIGLLGSLLAYRPEPESWYAGAEKPSRSAGYKTAVRQPTGTRPASTNRIAGIKKPGRGGA